MKNKAMIKKTVLLLFMCFVCVRCILNLPEGAPCTNEGLNGTCAPLFNCYSAAWTALHIQAGFDFEKLPELCSYNDKNEPVYCCTDCQLDTNQTLKNSVVVPGGSLQERLKSKAWNKCMEYFHTLPYKCRGGVGHEVYRGTFFELNEEKQCKDAVIHPSGGGGVGGRDAEVGEFPNMALLGYGAESNTALWLCGGSVISERFILTAAHCSSAPKVGPITFAGLGILKRSEVNNYWNVYKIIKVINYPEYKSPSKYHDIALAQTETEINFGKGLLPACVDVGVRTDSFDPYLSAPGWGRLGHNKPVSDILQVMDLAPYIKEKCDEIFEPHRHMTNGYNHSTQMCYGASETSKIVDTCEGDSGGPTLYKDHCMYVVTGVTSFGRQCGNLGSAGMYTRVKYYLPWIESVVWP